MDSLLHSLESHNATAGRSDFIYTFHFVRCGGIGRRSLLRKGSQVYSLKYHMSIIVRKVVCLLPQVRAARYLHFLFLLNFLAHATDYIEKLGLLVVFWEQKKMRLLFDLVFLLVGLSRISTSILPPFSFLNMTI